MFILIWALGLYFTVYLSIYVIKKNREVGYTFLSVLLAGYILISNILTPRLTSLNVGVTNLVIVTGSIIWPFTAQLSDMINEVYGKKKTFFAIGFGYAVNLLFVLFVLMANETVAVWDGVKETFWKEYFLPSWRVFIASSVSYIICQFIDVNIFSYLKEKYRADENKSKVLGVIGYSSLRSALSDGVNMVFDAIIFAVIAFLFVLPTDSLLELILGSILFKGIVSIIDTPLFALFRVKIRNIERHE